VARLRARGERHDRAHVDRARALERHRFRRQALRPRRDAASACASASRPRSRRLLAQREADAVAPEEYA
jgi:hypothetical protein